MQSCHKATITIRQGRRETCYDTASTLISRFILLHELRTAFRRASSRFDRTAASNVREGMSKVTRSPSGFISCSPPRPIRPCSYSSESFSAVSAVVTGEMDSMPSNLILSLAQGVRALPSVTHSHNHNERKERERPFFLGDLSEFEMLEKQLGMHQRLDGGEGSPDGWTDHLLRLFCLSAVCLFHRPPPLLSSSSPFSAFLCFQRR